MDHYKFLNSIISISKLFGLAPFAIVTDKTTNTKMYELSKFWIIYTIMFVLFSTTFQIIIYTNADIWSEEVVLKNIFIFIFHITIFFVTIIQLINLINAKKLISIINILFSMNFKFNYDAEIKINKSFQFCSVIFISSTNILLLVVINFYPKFNSRGISFTVATAIKFFLFSLPHLQLIQFLTIVREKYICLNVNIIKLARRDNISIVYRNRVELNFNSHLMNKNNNYSRYDFIMLLTLRKVHNLLCELAEELSELYCVHTTISVALTFIQLTVGAYTSVRLNLFSYTNGVYNFLAFILIAYVVGHAIKIAFILWLWSKISFEVRYFEEFSLQLLQRKVQFTACGLFPLDFTLLCSVS
ncbi:hypothetical protein L9F63_022104 [Diploptera punctata]|uniref:Gustatory receptor n=1 Tax=Diploptera punctata TaxID=6984 RepID=A0AAD8EB46_DIPPU|nr:hypothetical protein L9F63_022104 [Diploptera punctata]